MYFDESLCKDVEKFLNVGFQAWIRYGQAKTELVLPEDGPERPRGARYEAA